MNSYDNHLSRVSLASTRLTQNANVSSNVDSSLRYDRIEEIRERYATDRLRRAAGKTGDRSTFVGDRSNFVDDRSNFVGDRYNFVGDRGKSGGSRATSAVSLANS